MFESDYHYLFVITALNRRAPQIAIAKIRTAVVAGSHRSRGCTSAAEWVTDVGFRRYLIESAGVSKIALESLSRKYIIHINAVMEIDKGHVGTHVSALFLRA